MNGKESSGAKLLKRSKLKGDILQNGYGETKFMYVTADCNKKRN